MPPFVNYMCVSMLESNELRSEEDNLNAEITPEDLQRKLYFLCDKLQIMVRGLPP